MKITLIVLTIIVLLRKNFRNNKLVQSLTGVVCNLIYYITQYLIISTVGFVLNLLKILAIYIKDDHVIHGKDIYKRTTYEARKATDLPDPNPDDTCPTEDRLF